MSDEEFDEEAAEFKSYETLFKTFLQETLYQKKYFALKKKCEQLQQRNEKVVNRVQHIKKILKQYKKDRRFLMTKLDEHGDPFRDVPVPVTWEDDPIRPVHPVPPPPYPSTPTSAPTNSHPPSYHPLPSSGITHATTILQTYRPKVESSDSKTFGATSKESPSSKAKKIKSEPKDPAAPKKPINAYMMYYQAKRIPVRDQYLKDNGTDISHPELTKILAQQWNALTPDEKRVYYKVYETEKIRYDKEVLEYNAIKEKDEKNGATSGGIELQRPSILHIKEEFGK